MSVRARLARRWMRPSALPPETPGARAWLGLMALHLLALLFAAYASAGALPGASSPPLAIPTLRFTPDGRHLAVLFDTEHWEVYDLDTGRAVLAQRGQTGNAPEISPDGRWLWRSTLGSGSLWSCADWTERDAWAPDTRSDETGSRFSLDGRWLAFSTATGPRVIALDPDPRDAPHQPPAPSLASKVLGFATDGRLAIAERVAAGGDEPAYRLVWFEPATGMVERGAFPFEVGANEFACPDLFASRWWRDRDQYRDLSGRPIGAAFETWEPAWSGGVMLDGPCRVDLETLARHAIEAPWPEPVRSDRVAAVSANGQSAAAISADGSKLVALRRGAEGWSAQHIDAESIWPDAQPTVPWGLVAVWAAGWLVMWSRAVSWVALRRCPTLATCPADRSWWLLSTTLALHVAFVWLLYAIPLADCGLFRARSGCFVSTAYDEMPLLVRIGVLAAQITGATHTRLRAALAVFAALAVALPIVSRGRVRYTLAVGLVSALQLAWLGWLLA